jgi:hypothetical protein
MHSTAQHSAAQQAHQINIGADKPASSAAVQEQLQGE